VDLLAVAADPIAQGALAGCFALILFAAAWHKLTEPLMFQAALDAYRLLPSVMTAAAARALPVVEATIGVALIVPSTRQAALSAFALLMAFYAAAIAINLLRGRAQIDCGCGAEVHLLSWALVARNGLLALAALVICRPDSERQIDWLDGVTLIACVLALYGFYLMCDELLRQHGRIAQLRARQNALRVVESASLPPPRTAS
jgi:hypothetical protein